MDILREILPPKIYEIVDRTGICTPKQLIILSMWDIKKLTNLPTVDIELLKNKVAKHLSPSLNISCNLLLYNKDDKLEIGCTAINNLLNGGFRRRVLTEIYGESGSGKTQLAMQLSAKNATNARNLYICTEDLFPINRYNQILESVMQHVSHLGNNVFVEHVYNAVDLLSCIRIRLPKLLQQHKISLIIIDSVAAPFRSESCNYIQRAEELRELAIMLVKIAQEYNLAVVCLNQVTDNFNDSSYNLLPSLGLAWSNMVSYRLWLKKSMNTDIYHKNEKKTMRELKIVFAPDLPNTSCNFFITSKGITNI